MTPQSIAIGMIRDAESRERLARMRGGDKALKIEAESLRRVAESILKIQEQRRG